MAQRTIDLRSDTVTRPTQGMRRAIAEAEVGDDVFGDDPTVIRLEERVASLLGKEAALFVTSGTMGNQVAVAIQTRPGDEVFLEATSHIILYEAGAPAAISGVQLHTLAGEKGLIDSAVLARAVRPANVHYPRPALLCVENTHNRAGGRVLPREGVDALLGVARRFQLRTHLDGARLWNASAASGTSEADLARGFDTVSVCFSKGLGAPVGSVLCGPAEAIDRARFVRKRLGGGMRQAGILAAACLHALDHHRPRIAEDHRRARALATAVAEHPVFAVDPAEVETNIVVIRVREGEPEWWCERMKERGVLIAAFGPGALRCVTHLDVDDEGISAAADAFAACAALRGTG